MDDIEEASVSLERHTASCCVLSPEGVNARKRVIKAEDEWTIRNFDVLNLFYYPTPSIEDFWRRNRDYELLYLLLGLAPASTVFIPLVFLSQDLAQGGLEISLAVYHVLCGLLPITLLCNLDAIKHQVMRLSGFVDAIVLIVSFVLGVIFGQGFVILGSIALFASYLTIYLAPGYELHVICNYLDPEIQTVPFSFTMGKRLVYAVLTVVSLFGRAQIFLQVFTVREDIVFTLKDVDISIRDVWLVFIDTLYIRSIYITAGRAFCSDQGSSLVYSAQGTMKR